MKKFWIILAALTLLLAGCGSQEQAEQTPGFEIATGEQGAGAAVVPEEGDIEIAID